jgi:hypothetical protein
MFVSSLRRLFAGAEAFLFYLIDATRTPKTRLAIAPNSPAQILCEIPRYITFLDRCVVVC